MAEQLTFHLPAIENRSRGDFFVSPSNALALETVDSWQVWPGKKLILTGPKGAGKTHLAHVWAESAGAKILSPGDLPGLDASQYAGANIAVEDADTCAGNPEIETALFHLHNMVLAEGGHLLLTACTPPRDWGLTLPDLFSRVSAAAIASISPPDDALLSMVLVKLFSDRQISITPPLITYLVRRIDRSLAAAGQIVHDLDQAALAQNRALTRSFAVEMLDKADETGA